MIGFCAIRQRLVECLAPRVSLRIAPLLFEKRNRISFCYYLTNLVLGASIGVFEANSSQVSVLANQKARKKRHQPSKPSETATLSQHRDHLFSGRPDPSLLVRFGETEWYPPPGLSFAVTGVPPWEVAVVSPYSAQVKVPTAQHTFCLENDETRPPFQFS